MPTSRSQTSPRKAVQPATEKPAPADHRAAAAPAQAPAAPAPAAAPVIRLVDDPRTPEVYASACSGFSIGQGNVVLTLESARCNHFEPGSPMSRVVVGRIVLPIQAAQAMVIELNNALNRSGFSPSRAVTAGMLPQ